MSGNPDTFLPYHEPGIVTILIQSSFLLTLNIVNTLFDKLIFCGLLGQVFIGVAWGTPGAKWLGNDVEDVIVQLGYLGLILLVYEGGLGTNFSSLKANILLSAAVAITGISFPIALSFVLLPLVGASPVQAFAAGAALCSTSLGTTFTILSTSGLAATRLGTVLTTAAMMDDVVGLIMVQVISNLGKSDDFSAVTVVRPLAVSFGFALVTPLVCLFVVRPITSWMTRLRKSHPRGVVKKVCEASYTPFVLHTLVLLGYVAASSYAGTSNLFAAYLAGTSISWWDSEFKDISGDDSSVSLRRIPSLAPQRSTGCTPATETSSSPMVLSNDGAPTSNDIPMKSDSEEENIRTGSSTFVLCYSQATHCILIPFFFASIGFAIPITEMFTGKIVWRGILYTVLMLFAKAVTGLWLVRLNLSYPTIRLPQFLSTLRPPFLKRSDTANTAVELKVHKKESASKRATGGKGNVRSEDGAVNDTASESLGASATLETAETKHAIRDSTKYINKPLSLYPAAMLGTAMTARGEIGFLIASLAETTGLLASSDTRSKPNGSSEIYLVVTWAIVLCTIIGPLSVGTLVKRVRRLQAEGKKNPAKADPLGIWGVG